MNVGTEKAKVQETRKEQADKVGLKQEEDFIDEQTNRYREKLGEHSKEFIGLTKLGQKYLTLVREYGLDSDEAKPWLQRFSRACKNAAEK